jgi:hypothetical protein
MATEPAGARVYVVAFAAGEDLGYVALDGSGAPVSDRRLVKDAVSLAALAERAEEVSGATAADDLVARFGEAAAVLRRVGDRDAAAAAEAVVAAAAALGDAAAGPRPATPQFLDRLAGELAAALDAFVAYAERLPEASAGTVSTIPTPREIALVALSTAAHAGDPANFAQAMTAASGAVDALVADVLDHYRGELDEA